MDNDPLMRCLQTAKDAGCPEDQVKALLEHGYVPFPWQFLFHSAAREADQAGGPTKIGCGGSRGPGKSHAIFAQNTLDDCQRVPGLKGLFLRHTGKAAKESLDDLVTKVLSGRLSYNHTSNVIRFPNGSRMLLGGFKDEKDIDKYIGIEYDFISIEEINQLTGTKVNMLLGSMRTTKPNWRPRLYASFNPGGVGHGYVKATFVEPYKNEVEIDTRFIPATYKDNVELNPEYVEYLENLGGQLGQAWREGDFDILAGQYFPEWNERIHVVEPFEIPDSWRKFGMLDYGLGRSAVYWGAVSPEGVVYLYREIYLPDLSYSALAEKFVELTPVDEAIDYLVADPSCWNRDGRSDESLSGIDIFQSKYKELTGKSLRITQGNNDRLSGWRIFREWLRPFAGRDGEVTAKLQVFATCFNFIRTIPLQIHDDHNPEDLLKNDEDHAADSVRYGLMSAPRPKTTAADKEEVMFKLAMKRKHQKLGTKPQAPGMGTNKPKHLFLR